MEDDGEGSGKARLMELDDDVWGRVRASKGISVVVRREDAGDCSRIFRYLPQYSKEIL